MSTPDITTFRALMRSVVSTLPGLALAACSWEPEYVESPSTEPVAVRAGSSVRSQPAPVRAPARQLVSERTRGAYAASMAERMIGTPYVYGGSDLEGFDCSGLVQFAYGQAGIEVPRTAGRQRAVVQPLTAEQLAPGDLVFFDIAGKSDHVGLYLGDGQFVHAPAAGKRVQSARLDNPFFAQRLDVAGRVPGANRPHPTHP